MDLASGRPGGNHGVVVGVMPDSIDLPVVGDPALDLYFVGHQLVVLPHGLVFVGPFALILLPQHLLVGYSHFGHEDVVLLLVPCVGAQQDVVDGLFVLLDVLGFVGGDPVDGEGGPVELADIEHGVEVGAVPPPDEGFGAGFVVGVELVHWRQIYIPRGRMIDKIIRIQISQNVTFLPANPPIAPFFAFLSSWLKFTAELPLGPPLCPPNPPCPPPNPPLCPPPNPPLCPPAGRSLWDAESRRMDLPSRYCPFSSW